ncbi:MAG: hypothetical protein ACKOS8_05645 [Gemmataceae bacterium]
MLNETKIGSPEQMLDIVLLAGDEIVHRQNPVTIGKVTITQMRPDKARAAGNKDVHKTSDIVRYRKFDGNNYFGTPESNSFVLFNDSKSLIRPKIKTKIFVTYRMILGIENHLGLLV